MSDKIKSVEQSKMFMKNWKCLCDPWIIILDGMFYEHIVKVPVRRNYVSPVISKHFTVGKQLFFTN